MISIASSWLLLCFFFIPHYVSYGADTLYVNQSLSGNQTLVSLAGNFEMGFFKPGKSPKYYIGIWYNKCKITTETVVWVANRESPVSDIYSSSLKIVEGNLVLLDESNNQIWSTNVNATITTTTNTPSVVLLDNGNFVLRYGSSSSEPIWQSFDHPTDTNLPGSKFGYDRRSKKNKVITSWKSREDPAPGLFSLEVAYEVKHLNLKWNKSQDYWISGPWDTRENYIYNFSYIDNENESYISYSLYNPDIISRFILDVSGQIWQLTWLDDRQEWNMFWAQPPKICEVYGVCGAYGVCNQNTVPTCNCLTAFEPRSKSDWNMSSFSGGCVRNKELSCSVKEEDHGFIVSYAPVEFVSSTFENNSLPLGESACKRSCLEDCSCDAYSFVNNKCRRWNGESLKNISYVLRSDEAVAESFQLNIKVASKDLVRPITNSYGKKNKINPGVVVGSVIGAVFVLGVFLYYFWMKKRRFVGKTTMMGPLEVFVYRDLQIATKNFSERLGGGSFGSVFKGVLHDSSVVAVKRLESISQGDKEFRSEISTIGNVQHVNLVRLCGFCAEGDSKLLVYQYMPNGSLHSHLFHEKQDHVLNWKTRYQIAIGTARGLVYLHEKCRDCIIHCDIKPENILLDSDFCPKIADFGLAKLVGRDFSKVLTTMRGTRGYLAPEWLSGLPVTAKADVFSYGMMLFELVHGKRNAEQSEDMSFTFFPSLAADVIISGGHILSLLDTRLNREASVEEVTKICKVAYWCIQDDEDSRPSMSQVVQILEGVSDVNMPPIPQSVQFFADKSEEFLFFDECSSTGSSQVQI